MPKKILVVEPALTIQKFFSLSLSDNEYKISFANSSLEAFDLIFANDAVFINAESSDIDGFEFAQLLKKIEMQIPVAIYSVNKIAFAEYFSKQNNIEYFFKLDLLDEKTLRIYIEDFFKKTEQKKVAEKKSKAKIELKEIVLASAEISSAESFKNAVLHNLFALVAKRDSISEVARGFLLLVAEVCCAPLASLYIIEVDGAHSYYIASDKIDEQEVSDFFNVCAKEFEDVRTEINASRIVPELLCSDCDLSSFYTVDIPLSSYENRRIVFSNGKVYATINLARSGNFSVFQKEMLDFCVEKIGVVFENALLLKSKAFYESRIRKAFSRFVPAEVIDDLAKKDEQKDIAVGETRQIAILFSDIRSFTNISEKNKPAVLVAFLNRYFTIMVDIIKKYGGSIDKFIGDAIMAEFGTPISYEDNTRRAAMAAYEMRQALPNVPLGDLVLPDGMTFNIGIGIHYGNAIVGSIGSKDKTDYSVIGDSVNLASRLEGLTKTYGVQLIVSDTMRDDIVNKGNPDGFVFRHLDDVRVKGKKNAVPIYAIDRDIDEFPNEYRDAYKKGFDLYRQGIFRLAKDYFVKSLEAVPHDKAAELMLERCNDFIENPPENWDGAISFTTK